MFSNSSSQSNVYCKRTIWVVNYLNCTLISLFAVKKTEELSCSSSSQPFLSSLTLAAISKNFNSRLSQNTSFGGFDEAMAYFVITYQD